MKYEKLRDLSLGSRIAFLRRHRGLTQSELGKRCGFKPECAGTRIAQYESNVRSPKTDMIKSLSNVLNVDPQFLCPFEFKDIREIYYFIVWMNFVDKAEINKYKDKTLLAQEEMAEYWLGNITMEECLNKLFMEGNNGINKGCTEIDRS